MIDTLEITIFLTYWIISQLRFIFSQFILSLKWLYPVRPFLQPEFASQCHLALYTFPFTYPKYTQTQQALDWRHQLSTLFSIPVSRDWHCCLHSLLLGSLKATFDFNSSLYISSQSTNILYPWRYFVFNTHSFLYGH